LTLLHLNAPYLSSPRDWPVIFHDARNSAVGLVPANLRIVGTNSNLLLSWPRQPEAVVVRMRDDLNAGSWSTLAEPVVSSNGLNTVAVQPTNTHRWYRLEYP